MAMPDGAATLVLPVVPDLSRGDRAPNFALPDQHGSYHMLYGAIAGGPIVLVFVAPGDAAHIEALKAFTAKPFQDLGAHVFAVLRGEPAAEVSDACKELGFPVLTDPMGKISESYLQAAAVDPAARTATAFALDPNQRVLLVSPATPDGEDGAALGAKLAGETADALVAWHRDITPKMETEPAPVLILPNLLDDEICNQLIALWGTFHIEGQVLSSAKEAKDDHRVNQDLKKRLDHDIRDLNLSRQLARLLGRRMAPELHKAYQYEGFRFDSFKVVRYGADRQDHFAPHRDNILPGNANRMFALSLNLNDGFEGGGVRFPEYGPHEYCPPAGGGLLFSCSLLHEALPPTSGERFVLLTFLRSLDNTPRQAAKI